MLFSSRKWWFQHSFMEFHEEIMVYHGDWLVIDTSWDHFSMLFTLKNGGSTWFNHQQWRSKLMWLMGISRWTSPTWGCSWGVIFSGETTEAIHISWDMGPFLRECDMVPQTTGKSGKNPWTASYNCVSSFFKACSGMFYNSCRAWLVPQLCVSPNFCTLFLL